jgi:hypothetical protein
MMRCICYIQIWQMISHLSTSSTYSDPQAPVVFYRQAVRILFLPIYLTTAEYRMDSCPAIRVEPVLPACRHGSNASLPQRDVYPPPLHFLDLQGKKTMNFNAGAGG